MPADTDLVKLYSAKILALAASIPNTARLDHPSGTAKCRSPLCGSAIVVDVRLKDGQITAFGQDVKACALGQAAASIVGSNIVGLEYAKIQSARDQLYLMLAQNGPVPDAPFTQFAVLEPAKDFKNRHASIMLCFDATLAAISAANISKSA